MQEECPDVSKLMGITIKMNRAISGAEEAFEALLHINAQVRSEHDG